MVEKVRDSGETIGRNLLDGSSEFTNRNSTPRRNFDVRKGWLGHGAANPTDQKALRRTDLRHGANERLRDLTCNDIVDLAEPGSCPKRLPG